MKFLFASDSFKGSLSSQKTAELLAKDGKYKGYFPDLECCYGEGDTIDDAIDDANEAARNWLSLELTEEDRFIPYVSDEEDIDLKEGEFIRNISVNIRFYEGWDE